MCDATGALPQSLASACSRILQSVLACALGCGACATYGSHLTATPTDIGRSRLGVDIDAIYLDRGTGYQILPNPAMSYKKSLAYDLDLGLRANALGGVGNLRWRFYTSKDLSLALVPGLGFGFVAATNADTGLFQAVAATDLLLGYQFGARTTFVLGARTRAELQLPSIVFSEPSGTKLVLLPGGTLGIRFPVGQDTYLFPEVNVFADFDTQRHQWLPPIVQGGTALEF